MLVQIYEITTPAEAIALARIGVDHIGVLVGNGAFPRELPIETAGRILAAIPPPSRGSALCLSADLNVIEQIAFLIRPSILHLGASTTLLKKTDKSDGSHAKDLDKVQRFVSLAKSCS
jgi:phosphoribosylanthranilate isomerase